MDWTGATLEARFNVAPSQDIVAIAPSRAAADFHWGLQVPGRRGRPGRELINVRAESLDQPGLFRYQLERGRRLIIPASHFYEWRKAGPIRQPFLIRQANGEYLAIAGLRGRWTDPESGEIREAATILTTTPNQLVAAIHNRMPVLLDDAGLRAWLDPDTPIAALLDLLRPCPMGWLDAYAVGSLVNRVTNEGPELARPLSTEPPEQQLNLE